MLYSYIWIYTYSEPMKQVTYRYKNCEIEHNIYEWINEERNYINLDQDDKTR